jgi:hypothetical protein
MHGKKEMISWSCGQIPSYLYHCMMTPKYEFQTCMGNSNVKRNAQRSIF